MSHHPLTPLNYETPKRWNRDPFSVVKEPGMAGQLGCAAAFLAGCVVLFSTLSLIIWEFSGWLTAWLGI